MKTIENYIKESFITSNDLENDIYIVEGININNERKTISLTDIHNKGVDFDLVNNPIYYKYNNMDVISIFKRTKLVDEFGTNRDGNPFIYALKNKNGWKFDIDNETIIKYIKRFLQVCDKINNTYDTILSVPSSTELNTKFMNAIANKVNATTKITEYFTKLTKEEIIDDDLIDYNQIKKDYPNTFSDVIMEINKSFRKMKSKYFEAKKVDKEYLKYIKYIGNNDNEISQFINDKNILILDDIVSSGETISQCVKNIQQTFLPKSITIITLLSSLQ